MSYTAVFDFKETVEEKNLKLFGIHDKMLADALFPVPPVPYATFLLQINAQKVAAENTFKGGELQTEILRSATRVVERTVRKYRAYVNTTADGDREVILRSGFTPSKDPAPVGDMPKVSVKWIRSGVGSGSVKLRMEKIDGRQFIEVEVRPSEDGSAWIKVLTTTKLIDQFEGLSSLRRYILRARAKGASGFGDWSDEQQFVVT